jgi:hypothetical protein
MSGHLIIGLCGTGRRVLVELKRLLLDAHRGAMPQDVRVLAFDTERSMRHGTACGPWISATSGRMIP